MIIAIDPSINFTGYAFGFGNNVQESGVIRTKGTSDAEKLRDLALKLECVIEKCKDRGMLVTAVVEVPEGFTYSRSARNGKALNTTSMMKLSRAIGVILERCETNHCTVEEVPASWKGRAGKNTVKTVTGKTNHNEADAVLLYLWRKAR